MGSEMCIRDRLDFTLEALELPIPCSDEGSVVASISELTVKLGKCAHSAPVVDAYVPLTTEPEELRSGGMKIARIRRDRGHFAQAGSQLIDHRYRG